MNRSALKTYAPQARRDFIQAMMDRAAFFGITAKSIEPMLGKGDAVVIAGKEYPKAIAGKRQLLEERILKDGFNQTMEAVAYTWFNRFVALRYMELHQYLEHGYRVLSHPNGKETPEILEHAQHLDLAGLNQELVLELKLDGNKENQLYRLILIAQCNALHGAMPFLFERIDDETELLLPENLLNSDSLVRKLVNGIEEADWEKVEILGWLYQFYISEKKDEVIGKVVASEDIPAATQLFTPNWIVKYLVQNTLGRQWLATYPDSPIRAQMEFYIEPAEQEPEVEEQLKAITPTSLNPEEITFLDPAAGSGHILVEAYDLFKAIYLERGYRSKDIPALILEKNLFGLEIDDRAAQIAAFALMMKAREDDRRIFDGKVCPNVLCFVESKGMNPSVLTQALNANISGIGEGSVSGFEIAELVGIFENAKTFGSLIQVPVSLGRKLNEIEKRLLEVKESGGLAWEGIEILAPFMVQAKALVKKYDCVVTNPPYMGNKYLLSDLKEFLKENYFGFEKDLFSSFIFRCQYFSKKYGNLGYMSPFVWMFISSYEELRTYIIEQANLTSLVQLEYSGFDGATVPICAFTLGNSNVQDAKGSFIKLSNFKGADQQPAKTLEAIRNRSCGWLFETKPEDFKKIPGSPIAYWVCKGVYESFIHNQKLENSVDTRKGMVTADNYRYVRFWHECNIDKCGFSYNSRESASESKKKWFPYSKGGGYKKWYGNKLNVVNWENDGKELQTNMHPTENRVWATNFNLDYIFKPNVNWGAITSSEFSARISFGGELFDAGGSAGFPKSLNIFYVLAFLNSKITSVFLKTLNPTLNFQAGNISDLPIGKTGNISVAKKAEDLVFIAKEDWDSFENSWDFKINPLFYFESQLIQTSYELTRKVFESRKEQTKMLEESINQYFISYYNLENFVSPEVPDDQITLHRPDREEDIKRLISYAIGCVMGRYSLDKEGLIYANANNEGFDPTQYKTFPADDDGIVPLLNQDWGIRDDATDRFVKFISVAWAEEHLEENLNFVSESIGGSPEDNPREVIRNYFSTGFYKFHLQMYKRRPIYWLFSSGKQKAFQALVYLHRYNEGTLSRMRTEYVIPLQGMISGRIEQLEGDKLKATSTSHRKKLQKEQDDLKKQQKELFDFDEKLKHYADQRIKLDLDDGVKVNYGKFGDLLAEVKAVTGGTDE